MSRIFVPLDLETTGLDAGEDAILEIAWQVVDEKLHTILPIRKFIVDHGDGWGDVIGLIKSNSVVLEMHRKSGLAGDLLNRTAWPMREIFKALCADLEAARAKVGGVLEADAHLMGANISFDREFMRNDEHLRLLLDGAPGFHHRLYDVRGIKMAYETAGIPAPEINNPTPHRAASDVQETIDFARAIRAQLMTMKETVR